MFAFKFSLPFVLGVTIVLFILFLIKSALYYQKISQLSHKTSNYGIVTSISMIVGFAVLLIGFFFRIGFESYTLFTDSHMISRILLMTGMVIFGFGILLNYLTIKSLKTINKNLPKNKLFIYFSQASFFATIILIVETILRSTLWNSFYKDPEEYNSTIKRLFVEEYLWLSFIWVPLFTFAVIGIILSFIQAEKEIIAILPNYGRIPVKVKKEKARVQPIDYAPPVVEEVPEDVREVIERATKCKKCGVKLLKRFRFCPDCGVKFEEEATKALPKAAYCVMCGEKLDKKFRFCPTCGSMLE